MSTPSKIYLAGQFVETSETYEVRSPWNGLVVAQVCRARNSEVEIAIDAAEKAFKKTKKLEAWQRSKILKSIANGLLKNKTELAEIMSHEAGKPITIGLSEVDRAILTFTDAAEEAGRIGSEFLDLSRASFLSGKKALVRRVPIGVIYGIAPFNFPLNLVAHKIAPAIAAGCPIILKPSSQTPLTALKLAEIIDATDLPKGAVSILPMDRTVGDTLNHDERIRLVSFTGSPDIGWKIKNEIGKKRIVLELGGNAPVVVTESADLDLAADKINIAAFASAGQSCISVQRILIDEKIYDKLRDKLITKTAELKCGDPSLAETSVGPLIDNKSLDRVEAWLAEAEKGGAKILAGGKRNGTCIAPTLVENAPGNCSLVREEVFAPVAILAKFKNLNEAIALANDSKFGLQAGIFSDSFDEINKFYREVDVGGVIANDVPTFRADMQPYGGVKDSGLGREGVKYAIEDMTERKVLIWTEKN